MSTTPLTHRAHEMRRKHRTNELSKIASWRMSKATADAILAEHDTMPSEGGPNTLFGSPLVIDDNMAFGVIDLVPEGFTDYPSATH